VQSQQLEEATFSAVAGQQSPSSSMRSLANASPPLLMIPNKAATSLMWSQRCRSSSGSRGIGIVLFDNS
jgi:hypothetical protein